MATILKGIRKGKGGKLTKTDRGTTYTESWTAIVISNVPNESPYNVCLTAGLPKVGIDRLSPSGAVCVNLDPKQDEASPYVWRVGIEYSTATDQQDTGEDPDPTTWVPIYKGKIGHVSEVLYKDFSPSPKPYVNSAKCKFPEPLVVNRPVIIYDFVQYEEDSVTDLEIGNRTDTINESSVREFDQYTLKLAVTEFERGYFYGYECVRIHYSVSYKENKWLNKPLDMGYEYLLAGEKVSASKLVCLNPDGTVRDDDTDPLSLSFIPHRPISFSFLR